MNTTEEIVDQLYKDIANSLNTSVEDVVYRNTKKGERLIQFYYEWKYNWDPEDETTIPF